MPESIGQRLKQAREARYLTLERASGDTRIRTIFLRALEGDDFSVMPSAAQGRGFLRNYAEYLDLNLDEMIADLQRNAPEPGELSGPLPQVNLVETEVPPLTDSLDENTARRSLRSRLGRRPKGDSSLEAESIEHLTSTEVEALGPPKPRGRKKKKVDQKPLLQEVLTGINEEAKTVPVEIAQIEDKDESSAQVGVQVSLITKLLSFIKFRKDKESNIVDEVEVVRPQVKPEEPTLPANMIFAEIGAQLRARREMLSLTLDEVERHTRLRAVLIKALEEGAFDNLPSTVQTRGMVANYSTFLDLDTDAILLRYADALQARRREKYAETPREKIQTEVVTSMPFLRTFIAGDLVFGVVMIAILVALAIWGVGRVVISQNDQDQIVQPGGPSIVDVLGDTPVLTASLEETPVVVDDNQLLASPAGDALVQPNAPTPATNANVVVSVFAVERTFVRISVDGAVSFEGRMAPHETKVFEADDQVVILTGNAAAIRVTYNGSDLGLMGGTGEVVSRVYLEVGVATPTATIPPTPTNTAPVTVTSTPTRTPTTTPTVTPPDGG